MSLKIGAIIFSFLNTMLLFSQENIDSLTNKNFQELKVIFYESLDNVDVARKVAYFTLKTAKEKNNTKEISNSYIRIYGTYFNDFDRGKIFLDSSIQNSEKYKHNALLAEAYFVRGNLFYFHGYDERASEDYLKAKMLVTDDKKLYYRIIFNIGILKLDLGKSQEALEIFKECYEIELKNNNGDYEIDDYLQTLYGLSIVYTNLKLNDSASKYSKIGYKLSKSLSDSTYMKFVYSEGNNQFSKGNYTASKDSLFKSLNYLKETGDLQNLAIAYFYLGNIYKIEGDKNKMINYFKKVDSIFDKTNYIYPETRPSYELLIKFYENKNNIKKQLFYIKKLLVIDSILYKRYRNISENIYVEFDRVNLLEEKNKIENKFKESKRNFLFKSIIYITLILIFSILLIFYYRRNSLYKSRFKKLMEVEKKRNTANTEDHLVTKNNSFKNFGLDEELVSKVLDSLNEFENNNGFLEKGLTVRILAEKCNTNYKYLSKIINKYKEQTFSNYINNLRIDYAVEKIKTDNIFRELTIAAIADEVGFSNSESYAKAFFKKTGIHTSYFVKKIKSMETH